MKTVISRAGENDIRATPEPVEKGQESVWSYPRPPRAEQSPKHLQVIHRGVTVADTRGAIRTIETSHPPSYYIPPSDVVMERLEQTGKRSFCEWKGVAIYYDVRVGQDLFRDAAWSYPEPTAAFAILKGHIAFYAAAFDECLVEGKAVKPQPGGFYGGWITDDVKGPFKGIPGSDFW